MAVISHGEDNLFPLERKLTSRAIAYYYFDRYGPVNTCPEDPFASCHAWTPYTVNIIASEKRLTGDGQVVEKVSELVWHT